jgi:hypothetical protein
MKLSYKVFKSRFSVAIFYLYFFVFVISNSLLVENYTALLPNQVSYWFKHGVIIIAAFFSLIFFLEKALRSLLIFSIIILIYFFGEQYLFAIMVICFAISSPLIGAGIRHLLLSKGLKPIFFLLFIAGIPLIFNLFFGNFTALYNDYYGRWRLLLGYGHPKEAAAPFLVFFLLLFIKYKKQRKLINWIGGLILILISSRNAFFYFILFVFFSSRVKFKFFYISLILGLIGALFVLSFADTFAFLNVFSSNRFEGWNSIVLINELGEGGVIKADNFLVEIYLMVGWFGILAYLFWWIWIVIYQKGYNAIFYKSSLIFTPILCLFFYSLIDSGFASSGNLIHVFTWGLFNCGLKFKNDTILKTI